VAVMENEEMDVQTIVGEEIEVQDFTRHRVALKSQPYRCRWKNIDL
jgi:hypothetical protein